jgi:hypothetical protein
MSVSIASASTTLGSTCVLNFPAPAQTFLFDPLTETVAAAGVITKWGNNYPTGSGPINDFPQTLLVLSPTGATTYTVSYIGNTLHTVAGGSSANVNVPVKPGQVVATWGEPTLLCAGPTTAFRVASVAALPTLGSTLTTSQGTTAATVGRYFVVEPDADGDGFGDETQDKCPEHAAAQIPCPTPVLSAFKLSSAKAFKALVTTNLITTVDAIGTVKLPVAKGKKAKTLTLKSNTVATAPGTQQTLTIKYPNALKKALAKLSHKKSLKLSVTVTAKGVVVSTSTKLNAQLAGKK